MALSCGAKVLKYCLFVFNLIFFIAGCICLGVGIYLIVDEQAINKAAREIETEGSGALGNQPHAVHDLGVIMAVGGAIILVIAFLGCCGAYAICLMIILAVEIAAAIYAAVNLHNKNLETTVKSVLSDTLVHYGGVSSNVSSVRAAWDKFMRNYNCCGINDMAVLNGVNDFQISSWFKKEFMPRYTRHRTNYVYRAEEYYPEGCCEKYVEKRSWEANDPICWKEYIYKKGCYQIMKAGLDEDKSKLAIVVGVGVAVAIIQLIGIIFSLCLCRAITEEYIN